MNQIEQNYIVNREKGELGLSISTDLAISRALGKHPEIVDRTPPIGEYDLLFMNLRTLVRNFYGSIEHTIRKQINPNAPVSRIVDEIAVIKELIGSSKVAIYYCTYAGLAKMYPKATIRTLVTELQIKQGIQEETTALKVIAELERTGVQVVRYDVKLTAPKGMGGLPNTLLLSHQPVDLLSSNNFTRLTLLESHTGAIKPKLMWCTKLGKFKGKKLESVPFNEFMLQVFGDDGNLMNGKDTKLKEAVIEAAQKHKWTPATTPDRVRWSISNIPNMGYRNDLSALL